MVPITNLDQPRAFALISEMTSTRNLLAYGTKAIRTGAFIATTRDPIMTMLSIGIEKLYKLVLGLAELDRNETWPARKAMQQWGHGLVAMHESVISELRARTASSSDYVRGLLIGVESDEVIPAVVAALDAYGRSGRFYYLDLLSASTPLLDPPSAYWERIESAAMADEQLAAMRSAALASISDTDLWDTFYRALMDRIAAAIEDLWIAVAVCGRNRALGSTGVVFGFEVHPNSVGRQ